MRMPLSGGTYDVMMRFVLRTLTIGHRYLYQFSRGRLGHHFPGGAPVVWLTVPGRKSGIPRTTPLLAAREQGGSWVIAGSAGGDSKEPLWSLNARAAAADRSAQCFLEYQGERWPVTVELLSDPDESAEAYSLLIGKWRFFRAYSKRAGRTIPVFRLQNR